MTYTVDVTVWTLYLSPPSDFFELLFTGYSMFITIVTFFATAESYSPGLLSVSEWKCLPTSAESGTIVSKVLHSYNGDTDLFTGSHLKVLS